jgi:hypothetical protein
MLSLSLSLSSLFLSMVSAMMTTRAFTDTILMTSYSRNRNWNRINRVRVRFYHTRRLSLLRPSFISHGQPDVPLRGDDDHRPAIDGEILHQTPKPERRVLFHAWFVVGIDEMGGSWDDYRVLRVFRVVRRFFSNRPFVPATRSGVGDDVTVSRGESVREENSEKGATITRVMSAPLACSHRN